ncbi:MAG TPA: hypothetical protein VGI39_33200, partial [Polyangiaceae bacterium]
MRVGAGAGVFLAVSGVAWAVAGCGTSGSENVVEPVDASGGATDASNVAAADAGGGVDAPDAAVGWDTGAGAEGG